MFVKSYTTVTPKWLLVKVEQLLNASCEWAFSDFCTVYIRAVYELNKLIPHGYW